MSKKKRVNKLQPVDIQKFIQQSLRTDFGCTEGEIEMIDFALKGQAPHDIADYMTLIADGKAPGIQFEYFLLEYFQKRFIKAFDLLYWLAFTAKTPRDFYDCMRRMKKAPVHQEEIQEMLARKEDEDK